MKQHQNSLPVNGKTVGEAYLKRLEVSGDQRVFLIKKHGAYLPITWNELHEWVLSIHHLLQGLGISPGDKVGILSNSRPEWIAVDIANLGSGRITVPIYQSSVPQDIDYILKDSECKVLFLEDQLQYDKLASIEAVQGNKIALFSFEKLSLGNLPVQYLPDHFKKISELDGVKSDFKAHCDKLGPDSVASIVYTSGTTGQPKGAVLVHSNFQSELSSAVELFKLGPDDITCTFLPFAHILGRIESLFPIYGGISLGFAENMNTIAKNITEIRPTLLVSVPRIYEKIYSKMMSDIESGSPLKKKIFKWAVSVGKPVARHRSDATEIPLQLQLKYKIADSLVFQKIRDRLGGRIRFTISGGAPLSPELCEFFHACGIKILEGYGLTETSAAVAVNQPDSYCFGTIGKPMGPIEFRIAEDGELLIRGAQVFKEYYKRPDDTKEALVDGWFHSGDIAEITDRGFLKITDRKKEIIVLSGGKKVPPQKLENMLKTYRFISNAMVMGDKQKYIAALITVNEPEIQKEMDTSRKDKREIIEDVIKQCNQSLASFETIKQFAILDEDFTVENGQITPSLKLKRKVILKNHQKVADSLFI